MTGLALLPLGATAPQAALLLLGCRAPRLGTRARVALLPPCRAPLGLSALALPAHRVREGNFLLLAALLALIVQLASIPALAALLALTAQPGNFLMSWGVPLAPTVRVKRLPPLAPPRVAGVMLENIRFQMKIARTAHLANTLWMAPDLVRCVMLEGLASRPAVKVAVAMGPVMLATGALQAPLAPRRIGALLAATAPLLASLPRRALTSAL